MVRKSFEDLKEDINRVESEESRDRKINHVLNSAKAKAEGVGFGVGVGGQRGDDTDAVLDDRDGDGGSGGDNVQDEKVGGKNNNKSNGDVLYEIDGVRVDDMEPAKGMERFVAPLHVV